MTQQGGDVFTHVMVESALPKRSSFRVVVAKRLSFGTFELFGCQGRQGKRCIAHLDLLRALSTRTRGSAQDAPSVPARRSPANSHIVVECPESCGSSHSDAPGVLGASSPSPFLRRAVPRQRRKRRPLRRLASRGTPSARCPMGLSGCAMTRRALRAKPRPASSACHSTSTSTTLRDHLKAHRCMVRDRRLDSQRDPR